MNVAICYTAVVGAEHTSDYIARFTSTWQYCPPGHPCDLWVSCNGGNLLTDQRLMFSPMSAKMFPRPNDRGYDISGYQDAVREPCAYYDAVLCLGESVYFEREGWLRRLCEAWEKHGPGFYGPFSSNVRSPHLNTTAFMCSPALLRSYPTRPRNRRERFEFEHGPRALWRRADERGLPVRLVTWDGEWTPRMWRMPMNILWRGDQSNCLMRCNHLDNWERQTPLTKHQWSSWADAPFK